jgi:hypothetical protein
MTDQFPFPRRALAAAQSNFKRALVFGGGAIAGTLASAAASYVLVSALFPQPHAPAKAHAPVELRVEAKQDVGPGHPRLPVVAIAPAPVALPAPVEAPVAPKAVNLASAPVAHRGAAPAPGPSAHDALVIATKHQPDIALPGLDGTSESTSPAEFAARAAQDAGLRERSALAPDSPTRRPEPRPEVAPETLAALATPAAASPAIRPRPRPEGLVLAAAEAMSADAASSPIPALRPRPRPAQAQSLRLAAATPAPQAEPEPAPRRASGGLFSGGGTCGPSLARSIPKRSGNATGGQQFLAALGSSGNDRDQRIINELARGNLPGFLRDLQPVAFRGKDARGADTEIVICVTPDYLALGSDRDYVRVPLGLPAAASIASRFGMTLPTPRMVDAIYAQASVRLSPAPMSPGPQMSSTEYFLRHNATIEGQLRGRGGLVAGQKKDVVMANRMANAPGRVAIYGWHRTSGSPIQPVSTVHGAHYADYSHGIRLVSKTAYLNGKAVNLDDLLASGRHAWLLNEEGPVPGPVIRIASR